MNQREQQQLQSVINNSIKITQDNTTNITKNVATMLKMIRSAGDVEDLSKGGMIQPLIEVIDKLNRSIEEKDKKDDKRNRDQIKRDKDKDKKDDKRTKDDEKRNKAYANYLKNVGSSIAFTVRSELDMVLGPFGTAIKDTTVNLGKKLFGSGSKYVMSSLRRLDQLNMTSKLNAQLMQESIDAQFKLEDLRNKKSFRDNKRQESALFGLFNALGIISMGASALVGGIARKIILPIELLFKGMLEIGTLGNKFISPIIRLFKNLGERSGLSGLLKSLGGLKDMISTKLLTGLETIKSNKVFTNIMRVFSNIFGEGGIFGWLFKSIKGIGGYLSKIGKWFIKGFKFLGWPLQILMSVIDFIKGFSETDGDLKDKIIGGVRTAFKGFIELPVTLIGWVTDKVLGLFGVEIEGGSAKLIMDNIMKVFGSITNTIKWILDNWDEIKLTIKTKIEDNIQSIKDTFKDISRSFSDFFTVTLPTTITWLFNNLKAGINKLINILPDWIGNKLKLETGPTSYDEIKKLYEKESPEAAKLKHDEEMLARQKQHTAIKARLNQEKANIEEAKLVKAYDVPKTTKIEPLVTETGKSNLGIDLKKSTLGEHVASLGKKLGFVSERYESGGRSDAIGANKGDRGGKSYGKYQLATNTGTLNRFLDYLKKANPDAYQELLAAGKPGSAEFDTKWKELAKRGVLTGHEEEFIKQTHYDPALEAILRNTGIDISTRSRALQEAAWSTSVQHGAGGASALFKEIKANKNMSDEEIINKLYEARKTKFGGSSTNVRQNVITRLESEKAQLLSAEIQNMENQKELLIAKNQLTKTELDQEMLKKQAETTQKIDEVNKNQKEVINATNMVNTTVASSSKQDYNIPDELDYPAIYSLNKAWTG